jgi:dimeric dUTPase (all-alpha-NTP-PPase superfamily)
MLTLQQRLNDDTNGEGWERGYTSTGKRIDWNRCIYLEVAELIESYPWKHWKDLNADVDYDNIEIETIDIWHFIMSEALRVGKSDGGIPIEDIARRIEGTEGYRIAEEGGMKRPESIYEQMEIVEDMLRSLFCGDDIYTVTDKFFRIVAMVGISPQKLYTTYIGKNILNGFRQNHGYKDGTYVKIWNGVEDNAVMQEILSENPSIEPEDLYRQLEERYPSA